MKVRLTMGSLAKVGIELLEKHGPTLKCKTCGRIWTPGNQDDGRFVQSWWKCPNDPKHTVKPDPEKESEKAFDKFEAELLSKNHKQFFDDEARKELRELRDNTPSKVLLHSRKLEARVRRRVERKIEQLRAEGVTVTLETEKAIFNYIEKVLKGDEE